MPVSNFGPELIAFYIAASKEETRIPLPDKRRAIYQRHRLYSLRKQMRLEQHPLATLANGVQFRVEENVLIGEPADRSFVEDLRKAGIMIDENIEAAGEELAAAASTGQEAIADVLQSWKEREKKDG